MVNFKIYDVTDWTTNGSNTHVAEYVKKKRDPDNEIGSVNRTNMRNILFEKSYTKCGGEASPRPFYKKSKVSFSQDESLKYYIACFYCIPKPRSTKTCQN